MQHSFYCEYFQFQYSSSSFSFLYCEKRKENEAKEKKRRAVFYNLTVVVQMDVAGRACTLSLAKNARGTKVVLFLAG